MPERRPISRYHVRDLTREQAQPLGQALRLYGFKCKAHGYRQGGVVGGWGWAVSHIDEAWLASLIRACVRAAPKDAADELRSGLAALKLATDGDWSVVDTLWRLGGAERVLAFACKATPGAGNSLSYTWSFDQPKGDDDDEDD